MFVLALTLQAAPAWSKTNIGSAGAETFALNRAATAREVVQLVSAIRGAARRCDANGHSAAVKELNAFLVELSKELRSGKEADKADRFDEVDQMLTFLFTGIDIDEYSNRKAAQRQSQDMEDAAALEAFRLYYFSTSEVRFPNPCPPREAPPPLFQPERGPPLWITVQGGGLFVTGSDRNVTGTDTFIPGSPEVDRHGLPSGDSSGLIGGTATVVLPIDVPPIFNGPPGEVFLRTGIIFNAGGGQSQDVSAINVTPQGTGTVEEKIKWYVPVVGGVTFPVSTLISAEVFGGVHIARREASMMLTEPGAGPGALPIEVSNSWTSIDPAVGAGLRFDVGRISGRQVRIVINGTVAFVGSESLSGPSPNFATETYEFETGRKVETSILVGVSVGLP